MLTCNKNCSNNSKHKHTKHRMCKVKWVLEKNALSIVSKLGVPNRAITRVCALVRPKPLVWGVNARPWTWRSPPRTRSLRIPKKKTSPNNLKVATPQQGFKKKMIKLLSTSRMIRSKTQQRKPVKMSKRKRRNLLSNNNRRTLHWISLWRTRMKRQTMPLSPRRQPQTSSMMLKWMRPNITTPSKSLPVNNNKTTKCKKLNWFKSHWSSSKREAWTNFWCNHQARIPAKSKPPPTKSKNNKTFSIKCQLNNHHQSNKIKLMKKWLHKKKKTTILTTTMKR